MRSQFLRLQTKLHLVQSRFISDSELVKPSVDAHRQVTGMATCNPIRVHMARSEACVEPFVTVM